MDQDLTMMDAIKRIKEDNISSRIYKVIMNDVFIFGRKYKLHEVPISVLKEGGMGQFKKAINCTGLGSKSQNILYSKLEEMGIDKKETIIKHKHYTTQVSNSGDIAYGYCDVCGDLISSIGWRRASEAVKRKIGIE